MNQKLEPGNAFPAMTLNMTDGSQLKLPQPGGNYQVILFYRGAF